MEITGRIIAVLPERSGVSQRSGTEWRAGSYVLETQEQYPKKICFDVFGADRIQQFNIQVGEMMTVSFDIDAHEYQGRWFNSIRAFRVNRDLATVQPGVNPIPEGGEAVPPPMAPFNPTPAPAPTAAEPAPFGGEEDGGDLPF